MMKPDAKDFDYQIYGYAIALLAYIDYLEKKSGNKDPNRKDTPDSFLTWCLGGD